MELIINILKFNHSYMAQITNEAYQHSRKLYHAVFHRLDFKLSITSIFVLKTSILKKWHG